MSPSGSSSDSPAGEAMCGGPRQLDRCNQLVLAVLSSWACSGQPMTGWRWEWWSDLLGADPDVIRELITARFAKGDRCHQRHNHLA